jgi:hypothetical protein
MPPPAPLGSGWSCRTPITACRRGWGVQSGFQRRNEGDPSRLKTDPEKIAFWVNVYNTLVIHGVIELGITDSVKEVPFFFERMTYVIGGREYALNDIGPRP